MHGGHLLGTVETRLFALQQTLYDPSESRQEPHITALRYEL